MDKKLSFEFGLLFLVAAIIAVIAGAMMATLANGLEVSGKDYTNPYYAVCHDPLMTNIVLLNGCENPAKIDKQDNPDREIPVVISTPEIPTTESPAETPAENPTENPTDETPEEIPTETPACKNKNSGKDGTPAECNAGGGQEKHAE